MKRDLCKSDKARRENENVNCEMLVKMDLIFHNHFITYSIKIHFRLI